MIRLEAINKHYEKQHVLKDISFEVSQGVVGFLGPNGAGKSTTMKILTGYLNADSGEASILGQKVSPENLELKRMIGYLPENNPLYLNMYVKEYLQHVARIYKLEAVSAKVQDAIARTQLGTEQHKKIKQLSKGYKQRVGLAQAIIHNPQVLILDEPTSGLDPNQITEIRDLITELGKTKTILLSTHIMQEVEAMCQRVLILNKGNIVKDALISNQTIQSADGKDYLVQFDQKVADLSVLTEMQGVKNVEALENTYRVTLAENTPATLIFDFAVRNNLKLEMLKEYSDNLEGMFRQATN